MFAMSDYLLTSVKLLIIHIMLRSLLDDFVACLGVVDGLGYVHPTE